jgi:hypothetical protein
MIFGFFSLALILGGWLVWRVRLPGQGAEIEGSTSAAGISSTGG